MPSGVKTAGRLWLLYFLFTIAVIGFAFSVTLYFPIFWLSKLIRPLRGVHDEILRFGIGVLMRAQPWLELDADLNLPPRGQRVLLISNHRSHLDVFLLLSRVAGIRIFAKSTLFKIPFLGLMMKVSRQIRVERGRMDAWIRAMDEVRSRLRAEERVHIFPEMTRCPPGHAGLQSFTLAPFQAALQEKAPIVPMVFKGTDSVWPKGESALYFRRPVSLRSLPAVDPSQFATAEALRSEVYKRIETALK